MALSLPKKIVVAEVGPRDDRIAIAVHGKMRQRGKCPSDCVGDRRLVAANRLNVHELGSQLGGRQRKVQFHAESIAGSPFQPASPCLERG